MASKPGMLTDWPWTPLGKFKYVVLAPWALHSTYLFVIQKQTSHLGYFLVLPFILWRMIHNQIWISLSRHWTAKGKNRIVDKSIEFEQVDRESNWDDQIILNALMFYFFIAYLEETFHLPLWTSEGIILTILLHTGPVEFLYYWLHRALHHHYLYSRYHSHHHSSIATEPITSVIHPFAEHLMYFALFSIPMLTTVLTGTGSIVGLAGYITYIDFMNNWGHCNTEFVPERLFHLLPFLKYFMYTPSFHSLHHTQFRTNYSLFMPIYDYIYGTMDKSTDSLHEASLVRPEDTPDVIHLIHPTTLDSIYYLRIGFASLASKPYTSKLYMWIFWPLTLCFLLLTWITNNIFIVERQSFNELKLQTWVVPKFRFQYRLPLQREAINKLIEDVVVEAEESGVKVLSLGYLNQDEELNRCGELYIRKHPNLKIRLVDGSSLAVALVLNSIPEGTTELILRGNLTKMAYAITLALCQKGIQVITTSTEEYEKLKLSMGFDKCRSNLIFSTSCVIQVWLVGDGLKEEEQTNAPKGALFIPFSQFPPLKLRKDCIYHNTPAMIIPKGLENVHSCENVLPRRVMSAWRVAGIVHALEKWDTHECGDTMLNIQKVWLASLKHGFCPLPHFAPKMGYA